VVSERSEEGDSLKEVKAKEKEKRKDGKASKKWPGGGHPDCQWDLIWFPDRFA
jgi:hypothetical protein